jgi:Sec-independent protein secretion pathway component TatC
MSILEHIGELRSRLLKSCVALVVATTVAFAFLYEPVIQFLLRSYCALPASGTLGRPRRWAAQDAGAHPTGLPARGGRRS